MRPGSGSLRLPGREHLHLPGPWQRLAEPVHAVQRRDEGRHGAQRGADHGNLNVKYYGESYIKYLHLAPNSVVLLRGLCYSAGNSEPGKPIRP